MHPEITSHKKERCSKCGMDLVLKSKIAHPALSNHENKQKKEESYRSLYIIIGLIFLVSIVVTALDFSFRSLIENFMIGFFLVFSGFKILDLKGFAAGYSTYDLLAKKWFSYGYIYPFLELSFAIVMILKIFSLEVLLLELFVMTFSGMGVVIKLAKKEKFQCVCLGTFLKVPLTRVTLIEDFGMAFLAFLLILF